MKTDLDIGRTAAIASMLGNDMRLRIAAMLVDGPRIVGDIAATLGEAQTTVSKQLGLLRDSGILCCRSDGRCREYGLVDQALVKRVLSAMSELGRKAEDAVHRRESQLVGHDT